jgi:hypothetical protein
MLAPGASHRPPWPRWDGAGSDSCAEQGRLDRATVETFRAYVVRHWSVPASRAPFRGAA